MHSPEAAHPYYVLKDAGFKVTFASPAGGKAPLDQSSVEMFKEDEQCQRFLNSQDTQDLVNNTHKVRLGHREAFRGGGTVPGALKTEFLNADTASGRSLKLSDQKIEDYDAVFFVGGHGPIFGESLTSQTLQKRLRT